MDLNVVTDQNLLLIRVACTSAATAKGALLSRKGGEDVVEVEATTETSLSTTEAGEWMASTAKWITAGSSSARIEASGSKLVKLLPLLRVGQDLIGGLDVGEMLLRTVVLVRIGMVFLGQAIVGLLNIGSRCAFGDSEGLVRVFLGDSIRSMEELFTQSDSNSTLRSRYLLTRFEGGALASALNLGRSREPRRNATVWS